MHTQIHLPSSTEAMEHSRLAVIGSGQQLPDVEGFGGKTSISNCCDTAAAAEAEPTAWRDQQARQTEWAGWGQDLYSSLSDKAPIRLLKTKPTKTQGSIPTVLDGLHSKLTWKVYI